MKKICLSLWILMMAVALNKTVAQDLHLSQFYNSPLYRNPALSGIMLGDMRVQTVSRSQWNSLAHAYKTGSLNVEYKTKSGSADDYITWGLQAYYDRAGTADLTTTIIMPAINYHRSISESVNRYLSIGFMGGLVQRRFDRSKITTNTNYDTGFDGEDQVNTGFSYWDGSVGLSYNTGIGENEKSNLVFGVAYHHFNKPSNSFFDDPSVELDPKLVISTDLRIDINDYSTVAFYSDYLRQGPNRQFIAGFLYGLKGGMIADEPEFILHGGAFVRWGDAVIPTLKLDYHKFAFGLSYDVNISKLSTKSIGRGGFELSITYAGFLDKYNSSLNALNCPRF
jgi:type IX secretion system PorP/SprF family membrane protein